MQIVKFSFAPNYVLLIIFQFLDRMEEKVLLVVIVIVVIVASIIVIGGYEANCIKGRQHHSQEAKSVKTASCI